MVDFPTLVDSGSPYVMISMTGDLQMTKRRKFSREFKLAAVKKIVEKGLSPAEVARDLGISGNSIYNWKRIFLADGTIIVNEQPTWRRRTSG